MGMSEYTDQERMQIAQKEYPKYNNGKPLQVGQQVKIDGDKTLVGFVAEVHLTLGGEDSSVITDTKNPAIAQCTLVS